MDKLLQLRAPVENDLEQFSRLFDEVLVSSNPLLQKVLDHVRQRKGKMMRPALIMLVARLLGEINERTFRSAVSLELLHTASLIHDDVVDDSPERRGMPSHSSPAWAGNWPTASCSSWTIFQKAKSPRKFTSTLYGKRRRPSSLPAPPWPLAPWKPARRP